MEVRAITDPACVASWQHEPVLRRFRAELGDDVKWTWVMGGLARTVDDARAQHFVRSALGSADSGMPIDPRAWLEAPIASSYPACIAVRAALEQGPEPGGRYLRALREGILALRRKLDTTEALVEEARDAGLDVERFRIDQASRATLEDFGSDLEQARAAAEHVGDEATSCADYAAVERVVFPTLVVGEEVLAGRRPIDEYRDAARAQGMELRAPGPVSVEDALRAHRRLGVVEVMDLCDLPRIRAEAELWRLAEARRAKPLPSLTGVLWELA